MSERNVLEEAGQREPGRAVPVGEISDGDDEEEKRRTWSAAMSMASWPMWEALREETRSSTERLMGGVGTGRKLATN